MSLRRSPILTPASLAARRANALKSTGPRTSQGKARVSLNAFKHGRCAARSARLRERLLRAGYAGEEALYGGIRSRIAQAFGVRSPDSRQEVDAFTAQVWCRVKQTRCLERNHHLRTKLESPVDSSAKVLRVPSHRRFESLPFSIRNPFRRVGMVFWVQRRRYLTPERLAKMLLGLEPVALPAPSDWLEGAVRCRTFRLARPRPMERWRYGLDAEGNPDWRREPWRSLKEKQKAGDR